tara:strand:+ start:5213 stop:5878 length:666 start_codon:yes stop_codon:yes gene_type:complete
LSDLLFKLNNLNVSYHSVNALKNINIEINKGEKIAFIGPSGGGKTTLLKSLFNQIPNECSFIHQDFGLIEQLSVYNNVYIGKLDQHSNWENFKNLLSPNKNCLKMIIPILEKIGISEKLYNKVGELSGGQKQRTAIARSLYQNKSIILADEPVSSVDPHKAEKLLKQIIQSADTVIFSLHNIELAKKYSNRLIGIFNGCIQFDKSINKLTEQDLLRLYNPK